MAGWHPRSNGHEPGQTLGEGEGREGLCATVHGGRRVGHDWVTKQ